MEHQHNEDNANFGVTNSHFMDLQFNQQVENVGGRTDESGIGGPGGIGSAIDAGISMGAKFEENIECEEDEEEWKYIKEKLQSEKQQSHEDLLKGFGNGDGAGRNVDMLMEKFGEHVFGNGGVAADTNGAENGASIEEDVEIIKQDGEFSTTNTSTTHSPGDEKDIAAEVIKVEMKIEAAPQQPITEDFDEEEPSSLATNGTSSLSEHQPQQQMQQEEVQNVDIVEVEARERPNELDFEMHSQLNPEAKEFVPSFGSNPTSPSDVPASGLGFGQEIPNFQPTSNDVARHLLGYQDQIDDFVAQSPHKERCADMEAIQLPAENEFENEVAQRPHELEQEELILGDVAGAGGDDCQDFNRQSPSSFVDHGPETSVDLDNDLINDLQPMNDVMKQSIYVESTHKECEEPIEDLLNTVQPLPTETESLNASFNNEQELMQQMEAEKEMLQVDEKEQFLHSPSAEEMQMNLRNDLYTAEHAANECPAQDYPMAEKQNLIADSTSHEQQQQPFLQVEERTLLMDVTNPFDDSNVSVMADTEPSFEAVRSVPYESTNENDEQVFNAQNDKLVTPQDLHFNADFSHDLTKQTNDAPISPSPLSTEEKHLVEDTKESPQLLYSDNEINSLAQNMGDIQLTHQDDGNSAQMEPICEIANAIHETANPFSAPEPIQVEHDIQIDMPHTVDLKQNEEIIENEQLSQPQKANEIFQQEASEHLQEKFESNLEHAETAALSAEAEAKAGAADVKQANEEPPATDIKIRDDNSAAVAAAAAVAATTATAAAAAVAASTKKSVVAAKKSTTNTALTSSKPKVTAADAKKSLEGAKKALTTATATAARPRTAPAKSTISTASSHTVTEKKSSTSLTTAATTARKPFTARPAPKTTTVAPRPATAHAVTKTTSTTTAAAKSTTLPARKTTGTTSGSTLGAKSRATGGSSPTKPTTLGVGVACVPNTKPRQISPRTNLVSQVRKTGGIGTTAATAKSPTKPTSSVDISSRAGTASSRSKTVGGAASATSITHTTTTTTKRFVARPAPKITLSSTAATGGTVTTTSTTTTSRRLTPTGTKNGTTATEKSHSANSATAPKKLSSKTSALSPRLSTTRSNNMANSVKSPRTKDATAAAAGKKPSPSTKTASTKDSKQGAINKPNTNGLIEETKLNGGDSNFENGEHNGLENVEHISPATDTIGDAVPQQQQQEINLIDA